jgi:MFS family permease
LSSLAERLVPADFRQLLHGALLRFFVVTFCSSLGTGLILSLYVVYLHTVRHFPLSFATTLLAGSALVGLAVTPWWGWATDHWGPIRPILMGQGGFVISEIVLAFATTRWMAVGAAALSALFGGGLWGPGSTLLARLVPGEQTARAFGVNFMLVNLGIGFGGLLSASVVDLHRPGTFTGLYLGNAVLTLGGLGLVRSLARHGGPVPAASLSDAQRREGWGVVLRDWRMVHYFLASLVLFVAGYGSQEAGFSVFVVTKLHFAPSDIGIIFFFNTTTIVAAQLVTLTFLEGRSRTRVLGVVGGCWAVFWLLVAAAEHLSVVAGVALLCGGMVIFALGETLLQPVGSAIVNGIAPEHLRGRYNAFAGLTWGLSGAVAPVLTGLFLESGVGRAWPFFVAVLAVTGGVAAMTLRHSLTAKEDGRVLERASTPASDDAGGL